MLFLHFCFKRIFLSTYIIFAHQYILPVANGRRSHGSLSIWYDLPYARVTGRKEIGWSKLKSLNICHWSFFCLSSFISTSHRLCHTRIYVDNSTGLPRVREKSGKNKIFSRSGNCQGILKKCQGILAIWPMSGKCQGILSWQLNFYKND